MINLGLGFVMVVVRRKPDDLLLIVYIVITFAYLGALLTFGLFLGGDMTFRLQTLITSWGLLPNHTKVILHFFGSCCGVNSSLGNTLPYCPSKIGCSHRLDLMAMSMSLYYNNFFFIVCAISLCLIVLLGLLHYLK